MKEKADIITLDWHHTLCDDNFFKHLCCSPNQYLRAVGTSLGQTLFVDMADIIEPWMRGQYTSKEVMASVAHRSQLQPEYVMNEFVIGCQEMEFTLPELPILVKQLQARDYKVYIASDNMDSLTRYTLPALAPKLFDGVLCSHAIHSLKGDFDQSGQSLFFMDFFRSQNIDPQRLIHMDDSTKLQEPFTRLGIDYRRIDSAASLRSEISHLLL